MGTSYSPERDVWTGMNGGEFVNYAAAVSGRPGSGKTAVMIGMLERHASGGSAFISMDAKSQYGALSEKLGGGAWEMGVDAAVNPLHACPYPCPYRGAYPCGACDGMNAILALLPSKLPERDVVWLAATLEDFRAHAPENEWLLSGFIDYADGLAPNSRRWALLAGLLPYTRGTSGKAFNSHTTVPGISAPVALGFSAASSSFSPQALAALWTCAMSYAENKVVFSKRRKLIIALDDPPVPIPPRNYPIGCLRRRTRSYGAALWLAGAPPLWETEDGRNFYFSAGTQIQLPLPT